MNFGDALQALKGGKFVAREGWNGKGMSLALIPCCDQVIGFRRVRFRAYIQMRDAQGCLVPWLASQTDLLSDDWVIVGARYESNLPPVGEDLETETGTIHNCGRIGESEGCSYTFTPKKKGD